MKMKMKMKIKIKTALIISVVLACTTYKSYGVEQDNLHNQITEKESKMCSVGSPKAIGDSCRKDDKGRKPNTDCISVIKADDGYFIYGPSLKFKEKGSTHIAKKKETYVSHPDFKNNALKNHIGFKEVKYQVHCGNEGHGLKLGLTCDAAAQVSGLQYPVACMNELLTYAQKDH